MTKPLGQPTSLFDVPPTDPKIGPAGELEKQVAVQIESLRGLGYIGDAHAGLVHLAIVTARDIDRSFGKGAPSGRANLLRVMNEILSTIPQPEAASKDQHDAAVEALRAAAVDEDLEGVPTVVRAAP